MSWVVRNESRGTVIAESAQRAKGPLALMLGLLTRSELTKGEGLWLDPCRGIHTFGMRFPIDALFLDGSLDVVCLTRGMAPFRFGPMDRRTRSVIELPASAIELSRTEIGDRLSLLEVKALKSREP